MDHDTSPDGQDAAQRLQNAIKRASAALLREQKTDGHFIFEL